MNNSNIIIRKKILDLRCSYFASGSEFMLQQEATDWCRGALLPALEKRLEKYSSIKNIIRLDEVAVELNVKQLAFGVELVNEIVRHIEAEIEKQVVAEEQRVLPTAKTDSPGEPSENAHRTFDTLLFFLQHGFLPWWTDVKTMEAFCDRWRQAFATGLDKSHKETLAVALQSPTAIKRLLVLPMHEFFSLLFVTDALDSAMVQRYFQSLYAFEDLVPAGEKQPFFLIVRKSLLQSFLHKQSFFLPQEIAAIVVPLLIEKYKATGGTLQARANGNALESFIHKELAGTNASIRREENKDGSEDRIKAKLPPEQADQKEKAVQNEKEEGIYISNAGLVIVAPYLTRFFGTTGIAGEKGLNSVDLAVALLHWMATGRDEYAEFETVLPKILCGMEPEDNISLVNHIPAVFKEEATNLLQSVIAHWAVLKNTSVEGLQGSFLQREGKVSFANNRWLLQIEQRSYDMLLEHLPWSISMIKLPWMKHLLETEWM